MDKKKRTIHISVDTISARNAERHTWGYLKPVQRVVKSKKIYSRKNYHINADLA